MFRRFEIVAFRPYTYWPVWALSCASRQQIPMPQPRAELVPLLEFAELALKLTSTVVHRGHAVQDSLNTPNEAQALFVGDIDISLFDGKYEATVSK
jgi:hypothetical protein